MPWTVRAEFGQLEVTDRLMKGSECSETRRRKIIEGLGQIDVNLGGRNWYDNGHHNEACGTVRLCWLGMHLSMKLGGKWTRDFLMKGDLREIAEFTFQTILKHVDLGPFTTWMMHRERERADDGKRAMQRELREKLGIYQR